MIEDSSETINATNNYVGALSKTKIKRPIEQRMGYFRGSHLLASSATEGPYSKEGLSQHGHSSLSVEDVPTLVYQKFCNLPCSILFQSCLNLIFPCTYGKVKGISATGKRGQTLQHCNTCNDMHFVPKCMTVKTHESTTGESTTHREYRESTESTTRVPTWSKWRLGWAIRVMLFCSLYIILHIDASKLYDGYIWASSARKKNDNPPNNDNDKYYVSGLPSSSDFPAVVCIFATFSTGVIRESVLSCSPPPETWREKYELIKSWRGGLASARVALQRKNPQTCLWEYNWEKLGGGLPSPHGAKMSASEKKIGDMRL